MDQTKYGSFIKKMAEDIATGWDNVYPTHIKDIMISEKSNETIVTKVTCTQRMMIVLPL